MKKDVFVGVGITANAINSELDRFFNAFKVSLSVPQRTCHLIRSDSVWTHYRITAALCALGEEF